MGGGRRSGQVAVGVLLSVHSLQVLLLDQDVDAFLQEPKPNVRPGNTKPTGIMGNIQNQQF